MIAMLCMCPVGAYRALDLRLHHCVRHFFSNLFQLHHDGPGGFHLPPTKLHRTAAELWNDGALLITRVLILPGLAHALHHECDAQGGANDERQGAECDDDDAAGGTDGG